MKSVTFVDPMVIAGEAESEPMDCGETPPVLMVPYGAAIASSSHAEHISLNRLHFMGAQEKVFIVIGFAVEVMDRDGQLASVHLTLPPRQAREFAADLCKLADLADGGRGKQ